MISNNEGPTKTYNRFHDPKEKSPEIRRLRELHTWRWTGPSWLAYGWADIDTTCGFDLDWCEAEPADDASPGHAGADRDRPVLLRDGRGGPVPSRPSWRTAAMGLGWRYRWRPEVRDEVLARLLLLNAQRAEEERRRGPLTPGTCPGRRG